MRLNGWDDQVVGTEHILLGLIQEGEGIAAQAFDWDGLGS